MITTSCDAASDSRHHAWMVSLLSFQSHAGSAVGGAPSSPEEDQGPDQAAEPRSSAHTPMLGRFCVLVVGRNQPASTCSYFSCRGKQTFLPGVGLVWVVSLPDNRNESSDASENSSFLWVVSYQSYCFIPLLYLFLDITSEEVSTPGQPRWKVGRCAALASNHCSLQRTDVQNGVVSMKA